VPTVLVADDNSNIQKAVVTALKEHGIDVLTVGNGEAAVRKLTDSHPDLILADIFMPVRNGYEVCEYVKKDDRFAHIPVVLLVGAFDPLDEHEVERVHADGVLKKPFMPPDPLVQLVKSFLERASAGAPAAMAEAEDADRTQDEVPGLAGRTPTGTVQVPAVERTQRLEPETVAPARSGTVEIPRAEIPPADKTQRLTPEEQPAAPPSLEGFELGLSEPKATPPVEKTQQLTAQDMSKILSRQSPLAPPPEPQEEIEEYGARPPVVEMGAGESPVAFEDLLHAPETEAEEYAEEKEGEEEEERHEGKLLGFEAFTAAAEQAGEEEEVAETAEEGQAEAEVRFGGIREEAKTPDPERPPIPVVFDRSEPAEFITEEHVEASRMEIGPAEDLVSSSSGWASSEAHGVTHPEAGREPELLPEGGEGFLSAPLPGPAPHVEPAAPAAQEFAVPAAPAVPSADEFEETAKLSADILREEVERAQAIAARVAAQNREALAREATEAQALAPLAGPGIDRAISAVDEMLARHRPPGPASEPAAEPPARMGTGTQLIPEAEAAATAAPPLEIPAPPAAAAAAARVGTGTEQIPLAEAAAAVAPAAQTAPPPVAPSRMGTGTEQIPVSEFAGIAGAAVAASLPAPAPVPEGRPGTGTLQMTAEEIAAQAPPVSVTPEMIEAVSERVLAQLDPYIIEKISKEIVRPIIEAVLRRELDKSK